MFGFIRSLFGKNKPVLKCPPPQDLKGYVTTFSVDTQEFQKILKGEVKEFFRQKTKSSIKTESVLIVESGGARAIRVSIVGRTPAIVRGVETNGYYIRISDPVELSTPNSSVKITI